MTGEISQGVIDRIRWCYLDEKAHVEGAEKAAKELDVMAKKTLELYELLSELRIYDPIKDIDPNAYPHVSFNSPLVPLITNAIDTLSDLSIYFAFDNRANRVNSGPGRRKDPSPVHIDGWGPKKWLLIHLAEVWFRSGREVTLLNARKKQDQLGKFGGEDGLTEFGEFVKKSTEGLDVELKTLAGLACEDPEFKEWQYLTPQCGAE